MNTTMMRALPVSPLSENPRENTNTGALTAQATVCCQQR
jgi:hypothetical protein